MTESALYCGDVVHARVRPKRHVLRYGVFWLLFDLDRLDEIAAKLRLFSHNGFNFLSLQDRDHGDGSGRALKAQIDEHLRRADLDADGGRVLLFTMPRVFGYGFNPISIYFCHRSDGALQAILYEVTNTFGERHSYLIPVEDDRGDSVLRQTCDKALHVSPFLAMTMRYAFRVRPPGERVGLAISGYDADGPVISTALTADRRPLTDGNLARALLRFPLLTMKVMGAIHIEALRLWLKGLLFHRSPAPPDRPVTLGSPLRTSSPQTD